MRTAVVLPAPFGPENAEHGCPGDLEVHPAERLGVSESLLKPYGLDCRHGDQPMGGV